MGIHSTILGLDVNAKVKAGKVLNDFQSALLKRISMCGMSPLPLLLTPTNDAGSAMAFVMMEKTLAAISEMYSLHA
jgi:hypothetical protein